MTTPDFESAQYPLCGQPDPQGLCPPGRCTACAQAGWEGPADELAAWLAGFRHDPLAMQSLRLAVAGHGDTHAVWRCTDDQVAEQAAHLVESGRLRRCGLAALQSARGGGGGGGGGGGPQPAPPVPPAPRPPRPGPPPGPPPGHLIVHVRAVTAGGKPVQGAAVNISGASAGSGSSNAQDTVAFMSIAPGSYTITAAKKQHTPEPAEGSATVTSGATTHVTLVLKPDIVVEIKAKVRGTHGVRKPGTDLRAANVLKSSTSADESLSGNVPAILVRGCHPVDLEAVTDRVNQPVTWTVVPNENTDSPPPITIMDGGRKATLRSNVHGSFSVIATLNDSKVVWNVVFVWVKVDVSTTVVTTRDLYVDSGAHPTFTRFRSGQFTAGNFTWEAQVNVKVVGGGNSKRLGTDKVKVHVLQNGVADTLTGHYAPPPAGATALEVPIGGMPIVDSNGGTTPVLTNANSVQVTPNNTAFERTVWTGDSPAGSFPQVHQNTATRLQSISGINGFQTTIAGVSDEALNSFVVHARIAWRADYSGTVSAAGRYTASTANTTSDAAYVLVSAGTGGQDAADANMETFQPRFNQGTNTTWTP